MAPNTTTPDDGDVPPPSVNILKTKLWIAPKNPELLSLEGKILTANMNTLALQVTKMTEMLEQLLKITDRRNMKSGSCSTSSDSASIKSKESDGEKDVTTVTESSKAEVQHDEDDRKVIADGDDSSTNHGAGSSGSAARI